MKRLRMAVLFVLCLQWPSYLIAQAPAIRLSVSSLTFDSTRVGETSKRTFVISNTGSEILSVTGITVSGPDTLQFTASPTITRVVAGRSQTITVTFTPTLAGPKSATLSIAHNAAGSPATVALSGIGIAVRVSIITTFAGAGSRGFSGDGGPASRALLNDPSDVVVDAKGNVYIADSYNNRIRRVGPDGVITTIAGGGNSLEDGKPATQAFLFMPRSIAYDAKGNLYIADTFNNRIRQIWPDGVITTIAGNGKSNFSGDGGPATQAELHSPHGVAVDAKGNVYIADTYNSCVRRVDLDGIIITLFLRDFSTPQGIVIDARGNIYIADGKQVVWRLGSGGVITIIAGTGSRIDDGGPAEKAYLDRPYDIAIDAKGGIYIAEFGRNLIRYVGPDNIITTIAGADGGSGFSGDDGPATNARLDAPSGVAVDAKGNVYIADSYNNRIRLVSTKVIGETPTSSPEVNLSASSLKFDSTKVETISQKTFTISNTGGGSLSITGITLSGADASQFKVSPTTATIAVGASQTFTVTFSPMTGGLKSASLSIAHNASGGPPSVALSGTGVSDTSSPSSATNPVVPSGKFGSPYYTHGSLAVINGLTYTHPGIDIVADRGSPVYAFANGSVKDVIRSDKDSDFRALGYMVIIKHKASINGKETYSICLHMQAVPDVAVGQEVIGGQTVLGRIDSTGAANGIFHTHFEVRHFSTRYFEDPGWNQPWNIYGKGDQRKGQRFLDNWEDPVVLFSQSSTSGPTSGSKPLAPDFNSDGQVDFDDFFLFASAFGQKATGANTKFDLDSDGEIGFGDFFVFAEKFGQKV